MKKKILSLIIILGLALSGCGGSNGAGGAGDNAGEGSGDNVGEGTGEKEALFNGNASDYTFIYTEERDKKWEEDVVEFADIFCNYHGLLTKDRQVVIYDRNGKGIDDEEFYNEALREKFISIINDTLSNIPTYSDDEIFASLVEVVALLEDVHSHVIPGDGEFSPKTYPLMGCAVLYEGEMGCLITGAPKKDREELFGARLVSINGYDKKDIFEKLALYSTSLTFDSKIYDQINWSNRIFDYGFLLREGFVSGDEAEFVFINSKGQEITKTYTPDFYERTFGSLATTVNEVEGITFTKSKSYYYKLYDEAVYIRISSFVPGEENNMESCMREGLKAGGTPNVILDLRDNPGGYLQPGVENFGNLLRWAEKERAFVLTTADSASASVICTLSLKNTFPEVTVIGGTAAQSASDFYQDMGSGVFKTDFTSTNFGFSYRLTNCFNHYENSEYKEPIIPDVYMPARDYNAVMEVRDDILDAALSLCRDR